MLRKLKCGDWKEKEKKRGGWGGWWKQVWGKGKTCSLHMHAVKKKKLYTASEKKNMD